ncbi:M20/M25/M40 family metallo-hydrolase [Sporolactobacillus laevolacticus]|uniref:M20/M25/M40 family metallo-hydrolase n=1 Tax=Sporolactobacillus laevolacticus TaxID=33018 RepID=UPI0025B4C8C8|nr:M20/M25/M40 family metallo-hydrolase [Sporolactobacillus laevolacticus]MDN3954515.1 M20/M25/M40 family metallo-hydrolase [Sporolactobacillus laevolacticus]
MGISEIREQIDSRREEYLRTLFTLLKQKSISAQNIGIDECCNMLKNFMETIGIKTRRIETEGNPILYGEIINDPDDFTLLIYGHYDVQPPEPVEEWNTPPFEPTIVDGKIYCRGAGDNKGQIMAQLLAVKSYLEVEGKLPINVKFVIEGEEESSSKNLAGFVEEYRDMLKADLVYTSDGPMHSSGTPIVLLGVRGILYVEITAKGADWDNHSGNKGNIVPNPAWELVQLLATMKDKDGHITIEGFWDNVRQPTKKEQELIKTLPLDTKQLAEQIGYKDFNMTAEEYYRKLTLEPTLNIAGFHSGYGGEGSKTIIPSKATAKIDMRLVVDMDPNEIFDKFTKHVKKYAPGVEVKRLGSMKPSKTPSDSKVVEVIGKAVGKSYNCKPVLQPCMGGSLPDYVWTQILAAPSVVVPYANYDEANHSPNENIGVDNFFNGIKCTCQVIQDLGAAFHR